MFSVLLTEGIAKSSADLFTLEMRIGKNHAATEPGGGMKEFLAHF
jgi:hypothetical protein